MVWMVVPGEEELGEQRQCARCRWWWPADDETFWQRKGDTWHSYCRACLCEYAAERRARHREPVTA